MSSKGPELRLGPFEGGLNTTSDPTNIADVELVTCTNFELDIDGSLKSRPAFKELAGAGGFTERIVLLLDANFAGTHYLIGSNSNGVYYYNTGAWTLITNTFQSLAAVQYNNLVYLIAIPGSANPGGKWSPGGGFTAVAAIPKGSAAVTHKDRLYVVPGTTASTNASRLTFSNAANFDVWTGSDFIDVNAGDGSNLIDLTVYQDNLLLFKDRSSYVLAYDVRPTDAVLRKISNTIGVNGQFNVVNYENQVYLFSAGWVYELINYDFNRLNTKVPFIKDTSVPSTQDTGLQITLSLLEDRIICRYYKKVYVFGLRTRTWSEWASREDPLQFFGPIITMRPSTGNEYYSGSSVLAIKTIVRLFDKQDLTIVEDLVTYYSFAANTAGTVNTLIGTNAAATASTFAIGDRVQLYTNAPALKEATIFTITNIQTDVPVAGKTTMSFSPDAATTTASTDKLQRVPTIFCEAETKNFDMAVSNKFKRLWWWGADVSTANDIKGTATPIVATFSVTWGALAAYTWGSLITNTWGQPLSTPSTIITTNSSATGVARRFARFQKGLRYRQIKFKVTLFTGGSMLDGPAKLFTMMAVTEVKAVVPKAVN